MFGETGPRDSVAGSGNQFLPRHFIPRFRSVKSSNDPTRLSPGAIVGAPFTYAVRVSAAKEVPLQQAVVASFPNISAIHIGDVLDGFARVLDRLSLAIRAVALFCVWPAGWSWQQHSRQHATGVSTNQSF